MIPVQRICRLPQYAFFKRYQDEGIKSSMALFLSPCAQLQSTRSLRPITLSNNQSSSNSLPPKDSNKNYSGGYISWQAVIAVLGLGGAGLVVLNVLKKQADHNLLGKRQVSIGTPDLGGDWTLVDHFGNKRTNSDFLGKWVILYFGFSFCPDICPEEMQKLVEAVDRIDDDPALPTVVPIFITLDPERDTPLHLAAYVHEFSPKVIGMTGTPEQIAKAAKSYRIYYSAGPKDVDNDYIVDHSIIKYLLNPDGEFVEYYGQNKAASEIYQSCRAHMLEWQKTHSQ